MDMEYCKGCDMQDKRVCVEFCEGCDVCVRQVSVCGYGVLQGV